LSDPRHRLADDQSLPSVSEQQNHMGIERKLSERSVDYVLYFTRYYWDSGDFLGADVIEAAHRSQRVGQLALMRWGRICHMMRMHADRTKGRDPVST